MNNETKYTTTKVKFYIEEDGDVLAVFPDLVWVDKGYITVFSTIGGHSDASKEYIKSLKKAKPEQYYFLLKRLQEIYENAGFDNNVIILKVM